MRVAIRAGRAGAGSDVTPQPWAPLAALLALLLSTAAAAQETPTTPAPQMVGTWTGDFDGMVERRRIRALVPYNKIMYFFDQGQQRGATYELLRAFEKQVNKDLRKRTLKVELVFIPVNRDELIPGLLEGRGDIAAGNLTITPARQELVDFSAPLRGDVSEILVTGPAAPELTRLYDLSGKTVHVRKSSSYYESLQRLNGLFKKARMAEIELAIADENLEDADLLEMVNAGLIPMIVIDNHKAEFWDQIFDDIRLHPEIAVNRGGRIAWAFRKGSPKLKKVIDKFVRKNRKGTLLGNILLNRYFKNAKYVKNALSPKALAKFKATVGFIHKYAKQYDFDWLLVAALGYQESGLDHSKRSKDGAVGVMQVLPSTARDPNVNIPNIKELEPNIHAGVRYLHFLHNRYFKKTEVDQLNQWLFTFAAYNAGPARIAKLRREAPKMGLDPNKWFRNVEHVAAKRIGRETVQYVSNIYKYYIAYSLAFEKSDLKITAVDGKP